MKTPKLPEKPFLSYSRQTPVETFDEIVKYMEKVDEWMKRVKELLDENCSHN